MNGPEQDHIWEEDGLCDCSFQGTTNEEVHSSLVSCETKDSHDDVSSDNADTKTSATECDAVAGSYSGPCEVDHGKCSHFGDTMTVNDGSAHEVSAAHTPSLCAPEDRESECTSSCPTTPEHIKTTSSDEEDPEIDETVISKLVIENEQLLEENKRLESKVGKLEANSSAVDYFTEIEELKLQLAQAKADACWYQHECAKVHEQFTAEIASVRSDLTLQLERMTKQYERASKDMEAMVMKYATSERDVLVVKKQKEMLETKLRECERDKEILQNRAKSMMADKTRMCNTLDAKVQECGTLNREIQKLKDELNARDIKIKWNNMKLTSEMDAHKVTQERLDRALLAIKKHDEELKAMREEAERVVHETKMGEDTRANQLDVLLNEHKAMLILERQRNDNLQSAFRAAACELESLKSEHMTLTRELHDKRLKLHTYERERDESEKLFASLQAELKSAQQNAAELSVKASSADVVQGEVERYQKELDAAMLGASDLQNQMEELKAELSRRQEKEAELLVFTQKLTDEDVRLKGELTVLEGKVWMQEYEHREMKRQLETLQQERRGTEEELQRLRDAKNSDEAELNRQLKERDIEVDKHRTEIADLRNELVVQKKKHMNAVKDLNREIGKLRKKTALIESDSRVSVEGDSGDMRSGTSTPHSTAMNPLCHNSRSSSNASLNNLEPPVTNGGLQVVVQDPTAVLKEDQVPQSILIERIAKLQKQVIKKAEKIDFLEEHISQLVEEIQKKSKVILHYVMKEETGVLSNSASDDAKAELVKHGGIMASVYDSSPRDAGMTLELSLEINRKLQAVLEDTLLKNITLKENLSTLGDEVAKLSMLVTRDRL